MPRHESVARFSDMNTRESLPAGQRSEVRWVKSKTVLRYLFLGMFSFTVAFFAISLGTYCGEIWVAHQLAAEEQADDEQLLQAEQSLIEKYERENPEFRGGNDSLPVRPDGKL